jgi:hypothetical protein
MLFYKVWASDFGLARLPVPDSCFERTSEAAERPAVVIHVDQKTVASAFSQHFQFGKS